MTKRAYGREDLFEGRKPMMQAWADYCTGNKPAAAGKAKRPAGKRAKTPTAPAELVA
jgi:hypothetical protein